MTLICSSSNNIFSHLNINGYELHTSGTAFSRTACYVKQKCPIKFADGGSRSEVIFCESPEEIYIGTYIPFKIEAGSDIIRQFDELLVNLDDRLKSMSKEKNV
jgi:hypothetical protein